MTNRNGASGKHASDAVMPLPPAEFTDYIVKRLSLHEEDIEVIDQDNLSLQLRVRDRALFSDLSHIYSAYVEHPVQIDAIARTYIRVLLGDLPEETTDDYMLLENRIFPMIKPMDLLSEVNARNLPMIVYREFLAELIITYVIDERGSVSYISENHLDRWDITTTELHDKAIENLRLRTYEQVDYATTGRNEQKLFIFNSGDGYDASRILLTDVLDDWAREMTGSLVIGIPNRDFLIAFSDTDGEIVRNLTNQIEADAVQRAYGLTSQLFILRDGQLQEYEWE
ncbi:MAG: DUF1444 family protein [Chloroflexi bacterium AL-N1]|nr:DUF1444 family protein [Chloroflexi bacterium AL-N1]NOK77290.1 DUF1444 family protein [Chloroflexi bacterium AL-N5]